MKKTILAIVLTVVFTSVSAAKTMRFATDATYAPFEFIGANNKIQGFDIDLAHALCKQMGVECTFTNQAFDSLIPSLRFHHCDAVISGMNITSSRQEQVIFTQPYYENSVIFVVQKGQLANLTLLSGKRIGIQNGSIHQQYLMDNPYHQITAVPYDSYQNAILDLKNGRLDSVFGDTAVVNEWIIKDASLVTIDNTMIDKSYFSAGFGIAVRQNNTELVDKLNKALDKLKQDGTYQCLYQKWFK